MHTKCSINVTSKIQRENIILCNVPVTGIEGGNNVGADFDFAIAMSTEGRKNTTREAVIISLIIIVLGGEFIALASKIS